MTQFLQPGARARGPPEATSTTSSQLPAMIGQKFGLRTGPCHRRLTSGLSSHARGELHPPKPKPNQKICQFAKFNSHNHLPRAKALAIFIFCPCCSDWMMRFIELDGVHVWGSLYRITSEHPPSTRQIMVSEQLGSRING